MHCFLLRSVLGDTTLAGDDRMPMFLGFLQSSMPYVRTSESGFGGLLGADVSGAAHAGIYSGCILLLAGSSDLRALPVD